MQLGCSFFKDQPSSTLYYQLTKKRFSLPPARIIETTEAEIGIAGGKLSLGKASLLVPSGALGKKATIGIQRLDSKSLPPLPPGLINVTENGEAFRFLPEGQTFLKDVTVSLPVISTESADFDWKALNVKTFLWDEGSSTWKALVEETTVDEKQVRSRSAQSVIHAKTKHFTVMINAVLKTPEHPAPSNFNENEISSIETADPTANVDLIQTPTPNNQGTANVSFALRLPKGRGAFSPELALVYSSDNSNGPLGVGWSLPLSQVIVDTNSGVPQYDGTDEYNFDGVRLIAVTASQTSSCLRSRKSAALPMLVREYALRVQQDQKILFCSGESGNYWEAIQRNGVRSYYGIDSDHRIESRDSAPKVAAWLLQEVEDTNGNLTRFTYLHDEFAGDKYETMNPKPVHAYLRSIEYTSHMSQNDLGNIVEVVPPAYLADLNWDCSSRQDRIVSARFGFLTKMRCSLDSIAVVSKVFNMQVADPVDNRCYQRSDWSIYKPVRCYHLTYRVSEFDGKTLLARVSVKGADGSEFYYHDFEYTGPEYTSNATASPPRGFSEPSAWELEGIGEPLNQPKRPLNYTNEKNHQADLGGGYTFDGCYVGGSTGFMLELPNVETQLIDINSDGILDRVWVSGKQIRAALGKPSSGGGYHGIGPLSGETRSYVRGLPELEYQGAYGVSQSGSVNCGTRLANVNAGMSISLRLSYSSSFLIDADGDGRVDLLSGDVYYHGLPRRCLDDSSPLSGICVADGLEVCVDPGNDGLCFSTTRKSLTSSRLSSPNQIAAFERRMYAAETNEGPGRNFVYDSLPEYITAAQRGLSARRVDLGEPSQISPSDNFPNDMADNSVRTAGASRMAEISTMQKPETNWGPYTSGRRRLEKEGPIAASFDKLRSDIRWDAQHDGLINVKGLFTLRNGVTLDGVKISMFLVADATDKQGTILIHEFTLNEMKRQADLAIPLFVKFRWQIHFVFDPLDETPVSENGMLLDEVDTKFAITYTTVCPLNDTCRELLADELGHRGPTGQLSYLYNYPEDFRTSELPRQTYWNLMPPLGPNITTSSGEILRNHIDVLVSKGKPTETPVHVRVRCESVGSQHARDDHVCPLGTILEEAVLESESLAEGKLDVTLPQPFLTSKPFMSDSQYDCYSIHHDALHIVDRGNPWGWVVAEGNRAIHSFETRAEAEDFRRLLQHHENTCSVGPRPAPQNVVHGFLFKRSNVASAERSFDDMRLDADCINYSPFSLDVERIDANKWLIRAGRTRLMMVSTQGEAEKAKTIARNFVSQCFVGRSNSKSGTGFGDRHRDFVYEYFDTSIDGIYDPYRIMVEVDGENGIEIPPNAVRATASSHIVSIHRMKQVKFVQPTSLMYKDSLHTLAPETTATNIVRPLFRVHPSRHLKSFRVDHKKWGEKLFVHATIVQPKHPLHLSLTGDFFEGPHWQSIIKPEDAGVGNPVATRFYEVLIPDGGPYYLRAFTEASFDLLSSVHVKAYFEVCGSPPSRTNCRRELVPVNVLRADFGGSRKIGPGNNPTITSHQFDEVVGEVAHSFDPFSGGYHGFFYGVFKGSDPISCITSYGCGQRSPWPDIVQDARSARAAGQQGLKSTSKQDQSLAYNETLTARQKEKEGTTLEWLSSEVTDNGSALRTSVMKKDEGTHGTATEKNEICWVHVPLTTGAIEFQDVDSDGDGTCDSMEPPSCKMLPEDHRGRSPNDGCPSIGGMDSDADGLPDGIDICPFQPVAFSQHPNSDGCPVVDGVSEDPIVLAPEPIDDNTLAGGGNCFAAAGLNTSMCSDGGTHPGHENTSMGGRRLGMGLGDGMRRTWTLGLNQSVGARAAAISASGSFGISAQYTDRDVLDWNGDGIVDFVSPNVIDLGARQRRIRLDVDCFLPNPIRSSDCLIYPGVREAVSVSIGLGGSLGNNSVLVLKSKSDGKVKDQSAVAKSSAEIGFNFGGGINSNLNHAATISQRIDMNGDGLPDQIFGNKETGGILLRFNQGSSLSQAVVRYEIAGNLGDPSVNFVKAINDEIVSVLDRSPIGQADTFTRSDTWSVGGGLTIYGIGGSVNYSTNDSKSLTLTTWQFADINGDGLTDIVTRNLNGTTTQVAFNMGDHFRAPTMLSPPPWPRRFNASKYRAGLASDMLASFPLRPDPLSISDSDTFTWSGSTSGSFFGFTATSSYAYTRGTSRDYLNFQDMDNDGIPDRIFRSSEAGDGKIWVSRGLFGRANLLTTIKRPLGGQIELQYALSGGSENQPRSKWVLSEVILDHNESVPADIRSKPLHTRLKYEGPYYDRYEKADFGFKKLTIESVGQDDGETSSSAKRTLERFYYNRDFWLRGIVHSEKVFDASNSLLKETITDHSSIAWPGISPLNSSQCRARLILAQRYLDTQQLRSDSRTPCDVRAPRLLQTTVNQYDRGAIFLGSRQRIQEYDDYGNARKIREEYDGANQLSALAIIDYEQRATLKSKHIVDRPKQVTIRKESETGQVLRLRKGQYDDNGSLTRHEIWGDEAGTKIAALDLQRDARGYIEKITDANGYEITFTPDPVTKSLTTRVQDNFTLTSTSNPDLRFQLPLDTTDANGNTISRVYDPYARLSSLQSPYERAAGVDSVFIQYPASLHTSYPAKAKTTNVSVDPASGHIVATLDIARFVDGFGRTIQTQTQAEVDGAIGRIVSEPVQYDYMGRIICKGHPKFISNLNFSHQSASCGSVAPFTRIIYDALDRPLRSTTQSDDAAGGDIITSWSYAIASYPRDTTRLARQTVITDSEGKDKTLYHDAAGRLVAVKERLNSRDLITQYEYSAASDLIKIKDARDNERTFEYDLAGRRLVFVTPDTGRLEYAYDKMGNLLEQTDTELCNETPPLLVNPACQTKIIKKEYDKNRLTKVDHPISNDITLVYGDNDTSNRCADLANTKGRVCWVQDSAGTERTSFGALGETLRSQRTIAVSDDPAGPRTYDMRYIYDSFGRLLRLTYPDGEVLTYGYDVGARVNSAIGERNNVRMPYVTDRLYDVYGKTLSTHYGNGVTETNEYYSNTQRLHWRFVHNGDVLLSSLELTSDKVGNINRSATERGGGHQIDSIVRSYTYDDLHRLDTFAINAGGPSASLTIIGDYDYDDVGNITRQQLTHAGLGPSLARDWTYTYNDPAKPNLPLSIGPINLSHNNRGATKTAVRQGTGTVESSTYDWSEDGLLTKVVRQNSESNYLYKNDDNRIWRGVIAKSQNGEILTETIHYPSPYYTAWLRRVRPPQCKDVSCEVEVADRTKNIRFDGRTVASVIGLMDSGAVTQEETTAYVTTASQYVHTDQVESTSIVTDANGFVDKGFEYLPYGEIITQGSSEVEGLKYLSSFNGMELDLDTKLQYFGARYYDPQGARWISPDPIWNEIRSSKQTYVLRDSPYAINRSNPIRYLDPDGRQPRPPHRRELPFEYPPMHRRILEDLRKTPGAGGGPAKSLHDALRKGADKVFKGTIFEGSKMSGAEIDRAKDEAAGMWLKGKLDSTKDPWVLYRFRRHIFVGWRFESAEIYSGRVDSILSADSPNEMYLIGPLSFPPGYVDPGGPMSHPDFPHATVPSPDSNIER